MRTRYIDQFKIAVENHVIQFYDIIPYEDMYVKLGKTQFVQDINDVIN